MAAFVSVQSAPVTNAQAPPMRMPDYLLHVGVGITNPQRVKALGYTVPCASGNPAQVFLGLWAE
ncbi:MAG: hypothetical protein M0Z46_06525 [Actinomycetota bacterium]|nr:hypothetical protein [Actinomycetota bacterium]MDA8358953.1 hypothetical protein [Actinomycetota bacterium]